MNLSVCMKMKWRRKKSAGESERLTMKKCEIEIVVFKKNKVGKLNGAWEEFLKFETANFQYK